VSRGNQSNCCFSLIDPSPVPRRRRLTRRDLLWDERSPSTRARAVGEYLLDRWRKVIELKLNAVMHGLRAQLSVMTKNGGGSVVNMASILASVGFPNSSAHVTAKHGVVGLS
jgi:NAD(P)-dependent dehydrogenase (short-subunit alcohol dehydrogenase family)